MEIILYVANLASGNTALERYRALRKLGYRVDAIDRNRISRSILQKAADNLAQVSERYLDLTGINRAILQRVKEESYDTLWIDKGKDITRATLKKIKKRKPSIQIVQLNPDDPFGKYHRGWAPHNRAIPYYDVHFVSRRENVKEFLAQGAKKVFYYDRSFSSDLHRPVSLTGEEKELYACDVGFIGSYEQERARQIAFLIEQGVPVRVYGNGWEGRPYWKIIEPHHQKRALLGEEYTKGLCGMKIALHFLRKANRDEQDSRTFEIPACGSFMLAERSPRHIELFQEGEEAVFFTSEQELLDKVQYYLRHPQIRNRIAAAGRKRVVESGYDHESRLKQLLSIVEENIR